MPKHPDPTPSRPLSRRPAARPAGRPGSPRSMRARAWSCGLLLAGALPLPAQADTLWICALTPAQTRLVCLADADLAQDPATADPVTALPGPPSTTTTTAAPTLVRGQRYPLDVRRRYEIDLLGPAADLDLVEQLARGTLCLRTPGCQVLLTGGPQAPLQGAMPSTAFGWVRSRG